MKERQVFRNSVRKVEFVGDHPEFETGKEYSYVEYSRGISKNNPGQTVSSNTMKQRLYRKSFCDNDDLRTLSDSKIAAGQRLGFSQEKRIELLSTSRLDSKSERMMGKWLKVVL